ncbi:MAG: aldo/keto reductase, partial [Clostridia bacterium]|nr:aldo/keto reductase [Clostridia bacterium]
MEYITLGKSGLRISRVGLGGIPIQRTDEDGAKTVMDACEENGINFIDTARGYTVSEQYIGKALEGRRDRFIIATKSMARTYEAMKKDISISLGNLKTDHIDLYQVHNPSSVDEVKKVCQPGGALEALLEAKENGLV